jgi:hypothetical protein
MNLNLKDTLTLNNTTLEMMQPDIDYYAKKGWHIRVFDDNPEDTGIRKTLWGVECQMDLPLPKTRAECLEAARESKRLKKDGGVE